MAARRSTLAVRLGRRIVSLRNEIGLTQEQLAWSAERSKSYLSRIESGQRLPSLRILEQLALCLRVEPRDLLLFPDTSTVAAAMERTRRGGEPAAARVVDLCDRLALELANVRPLRAAEPRRLPKKKP